MMRWDKMYLKKVRKAGLNMPIYERYVDDSNQIATVPPPGSKYDKNTGKIVVDESEFTLENSEERSARVLKSTANEVQDGIVMEEDIPSKHDDKKIPILDMKVWIDEKRFGGI